MIQDIISGYFNFFTMFDTYVANFHIHHMSPKTRHSESRLLINRAARVLTDEKAVFIDHLVHCHFSFVNILAKVEK